MTATRTRPVPLRRVAGTAAVLALVGTALAVPVSADESPGAAATRAKMTLKINGTQFLQGEPVKADIDNGQPGCKVTVELSGNNEGGRATVKINSAGNANPPIVFEGIPAATGTYVLTATVKKTSTCKQASAQDSFHVYDPSVTGPKSVAVGSTVTIRAKSYPAGSTLTWRVFRNGKQWSGGTTRVSSNGTSSLRVSADKSGNYSVKASTGKFVDGWAFAAS